jgi:type II secretion system protein C
MKELRYHILNLLSVLLFSYTLASSVNALIRYSLQPDQQPVRTAVESHEGQRISRDYSQYAVITEKNFFRLPGSGLQSGAPGPAPLVPLDNLILMGTITGPPVITRAMIMKKGDKNAGVFALWKISSDITNDVFGYKLVKVDEDFVTLSFNGEKSLLRFPSKDTRAGQPGIPPQGAAPGNVFKQNVSRAEIKQQVLNNMDDASKGLVISPYRENNLVAGYRMTKVSRSNILYKYGVRSGDIIKRLNGHPMDSMEKLYKMWDTLQNESRLVLDVDRDGKLLTFDLNISD